MKNIKSLLLSMSLLLIFFACNDEFMDRYPKDALSDNSFWNNENDLKSYANRFYPSLPSAGGKGWDDMSDVKVPRSINSYLDGQYIVPSSGGGWSTGNWSNIRACNYFLQRYHTAKGNKTQISVYVGEVRFFRAWYYYSKMRRFGDVPWLSTDLGTSDKELLYGARTPRAQVVDSIVADLDFAIKNLLPKSKTESGRIHSDVAKAFKARVCLYEGTHRKYHNDGDANALLQLAKKESSELIQSGRYSLYDTGKPNIDYYNLFIQENLAGNSEAILFRSYIKDVQQHNATRQVEEAYSGLSKFMVESYLCTDGLPIGKSPLYLGDDSLEVELKDRDPRLMQTIDNKKLPFKINAAGEKVYNPLPIIDPNYCTTGYYVMKYHSPDEEQWNANQSTLDWFIFRYAETLLIYAEASAELGSITQNDLDISINKLRARVGMPSLKTDVGFVDANWPAYGYDLSPVLYEIRRERSVELVNEGFRWDDIVRWKAGKLIENKKSLLGMKIHPKVAEQYGSQVDNIALTPERLIKVYPAKDMRKWDDKLYLFPLPTDQLTLNKNLTQNPGWN
ncbi:RagB/SusD family nutrient uptake outer membrane protein [Prolixibacteraceae bacterium JC049]|nr:RagB/SusD family nutrient uptake outer membrane protein [Prolixibacteraceae bacterium JC049]